MDLAAGEPFARGTSQRGPRHLAIAPQPDSDPRAAAREAGLRYVSADSPGIRRRKTRRGFRYVDANGAPVTDHQLLERIGSLAIPPAWTDVWIAPRPNAHLQATGRDAKRRKQYRYHPKWREVRDAVKFDRMAAFGRALPALRRRVDADLSLPGLPRQKVIATVIRLMEHTLIRVGNDEYSRHNGSHGLTTMRDEHAEVTSTTVRFEFKGKSGKLHSVGVRDRRLARIVKRCQHLPGEELFQYLDETGDRRSISSGDVNAYLREVTGSDFTAKDFRTWYGSVLASAALLEIGPFQSDAELKRNVNIMLDSVAARLGNTRTVCRKSYVHPLVIEAYEAGRLDERLGRRRLRELDDAEAAFLRLVEHAAS